MIGTKAADDRIEATPSASRKIGEMVQIVGVIGGAGDTFGITRQYRSSLSTPGGDRTASTWTFDPSARQQPDELEGVQRADSVRRQNRNCLSTPKTMQVREASS